MECHFGEWLLNMFNGYVKNDIVFYWETEEKINKDGGMSVSFCMKEPFKQMSLLCKITDYFHFVWNLNLYTDCLKRTTLLMNIFPLDFWFPLSPPKTKMREKKKEWQIYLL